VPGGTAQEAPSTCATASSGEAGSHAAVSYRQQLERAAELVFRAPVGAAELVLWTAVGAAELVFRAPAGAAELVFRTAVGAAQFIFRARGVRGAQRVSACLICHCDLLRNVRYRHPPPLPIVSSACEDGSTGVWPLVRAALPFLRTWPGIPSLPADLAASLANRWLIFGQLAEHE
jgi:hypothetical protein